MSLIDVQNLTFAYDGSYENIFENVSFQIDTDWRLGFVGRNGRGKTTFLRLLLGQYPYQGKISASVDFAYFPYPVEEPERTVAEVAERLSPGGETWELEREHVFQKEGRPDYCANAGEDGLLILNWFLREAPPDLEDLEAVEVNGIRCPVE